MLRNNVSVLYDSNILGRKNSAEDVLWTYSPTLEFRRNGGFVKMDAELGGEFGVFHNHGEYDYQNFRSRVDLTFPNDEGYPFEARLSGSFGQISDLDRFLGERTESELSTITAELRYDFTERWALSMGLGWSDTTYRGGSGESQQRYVDQSLMRAES